MISLSLSGRSIPGLFIKKITLYDDLRLFFSQALLKYFEKAI
jgi:hypothetical protein